MPAIIAMFGASLKYLMAYAVTRFLLAIGLSYVTYKGMDTLISNMEIEIQGQFSGLGADVFALLAMMGADVGISIMFSAITIRLLLIGFSGGVKSGLKFTGITGP